MEYSREIELIYNFRTQSFTVETFNQRIGLNFFCGTWRTVVCSLKAIFCRLGNLQNTENIYIYACLFVCPFVSNKRQNG